MQVISEHTVYLGDNTSNNVAAYTGLLKGLTAMNSLLDRKDIDATRLLIRTW